MFFPTHFKRSKGITATADAPAIGTGTDPVPGFPHGATTYQPPQPVAPGATGVGANMLFTKSGSVQSIAPPQRIAVGYRYDDGAGGAGPAISNALLFAFDRNTLLWYQVDKQNLADGTITYFKGTWLADPPQNGANLTGPQGGGTEYLLCVPDPGTGAGTFHFVMGPDLAKF